MGVMRADLVHALHRAGFADVDVRTVLSPAWTTDWISARRPPQARRRRHRPARDGAGPHRRPGAAAARPDPAHGRLPAVRLGRHRGAERVRRHRLQGAAPLPRLRRAVRARQGDLSRDRPEPLPRPARRPQFHPLTVAAGRAADRRRGRRHLRRPRRARRGLPLRARPGAHPAPGRRRPRRAPLLLHLRADGRRRRGSASARCPAGSSPPTWCTRCGPATRSRCCRRRAPSPPTCPCPATTCSSSPARASPRRCRWPARCCATGESTVTVFYGNRRTNTVMFADELADLKDRYGTRLQLVHVLSREPRDAELTSGRLDGDRLRTPRRRPRRRRARRPLVAVRPARDGRRRPRAARRARRAGRAGAPGAVLRRRRPAGAGPRRRGDRRPGPAAR